MATRKDSDDDPEPEPDGEEEFEEDIEDEDEEEYDYGISIIKSSRSAQETDEVQSSSAPTSHRRFHIPPPLPLFKFEQGKDDEDTKRARTVNGVELPAIDNTFGKPLGTLPTFPSKERPLGVDSLHDPIISRLLSKWFKARGIKEANCRQLELDEGNISATAPPTANGLGSLNSDEERVALIDEIVFDSPKFGDIDVPTPTIGSSDPSPASLTQLELGSTASLDANSFSIANVVAGIDRTSTPSSTGNDDPQAEMETAGPSFQSFQRDNVSTTDNPSPTITKTTRPISESSLVFNSHFESGNLARAVRVYHRDKLMTARSVDYLKECVVPEEVHQEYDLWARNDLFTEGNVQWYYFSASCMHLKKCATKRARSRSFGNSLDVGSTDHVNDAIFPLRVRFNIVNMQKNDALYNYGMRPAVYSSILRQSEGWRNIGEDVCYYKNGNTCIKQDNAPAKKKRTVKLKRLYSLSFTYTFTGPDIVYFAHCFPYTYSDLQRYLASLESDSRVSGLLHRRLLCRTLAGNRCDLLTITSKNFEALDPSSKPAIVISARVHPGETNSSYMMHGILEFLTSSTEEAELLRKHFVFKIVPMLNPDGVIHGNYRSSLSGSDLNRRYQNTNPAFYPTISAFKTMLKALQSERKIYLFLDLHGHSKKKNTFVYGCDLVLQPQYLVERVMDMMTPEDIFNRRVHARLFPKVLAMLNGNKSGGYFNFLDCNFGISKSKAGTGRVVGWSELRIDGSYTIEASFCSVGNNNEVALLKRFDQSISAFEASNLLSSRVRCRSASGSNSKQNNTTSSEYGNLDVVSAAADIAAAAQSDVLNHLGSNPARPISGNRRSISNSSSAVGSPGIAFRSSRRSSIDSNLSGKATLTKSQSTTAAGIASTDPQVSISPLLLPSSSVAPNIPDSSSTRKLPPYLNSVKDLIESFGKIKHYSKDDYKNMGRSICISILHFANIGNPNYELEDLINDQVEAMFGPDTTIVHSSMLSRTSSNILSCQSMPQVAPVAVSRLESGQTCGKSSRDNSGTSIMASPLLTRQSSGGESGRIAHGSGVNSGREKGDVKQLSPRLSKTVGGSQSNSSAIAVDTISHAAADSDVTENECPSDHDLPDSAEAVTFPVDEIPLGGETHSSTRSKSGLRMPSLQTWPRQCLFTPITATGVYANDAIEYGLRIMPVLSSLSSEGAIAGVGVRFRCEVEMRKYVADLILSAAAATATGGGENASEELSGYAASISGSCATGDMSCFNVGGADQRLEAEEEVETVFELESCAGSDSDPSVDNVPLPSSVLAGNIKDASTLLNVLTQVVDRREQQAAKAMKLANEKKKKKKKKKAPRGSIFDSGLQSNSSKLPIPDAPKLKPVVSKSTIRPAPRQTTIFSHSRRSSELSSTADLNYAMDSTEIHDEESQSPLQLYYRTLLASTSKVTISPPTISSSTSAKDLTNARELRPARDVSDDQSGQRNLSIVALSFGGKTDKVATAQPGTVRMEGGDIPAQGDPNLAQSSFEKISVITANRKLGSSSRGRSASRSAGSISPSPSRAIGMGQSQSSLINSNLPDTFSLPQDSYLPNQDESRGSSLETSTHNRSTNSGASGRLTTGNGSTSKGLSRGVGSVPVVNKSASLKSVSATGASQSGSSGELSNPRRYSSSDTPH